MKKLIIIFFVLIILCGCSKDNDIYGKNIYVMDTVINIKVYSEKDASDILEKIEELYNEYNILTDRYNSYDDTKNIYYINNILNVGEEVKLDYKLYDLINFSLEFSKKYDKVNIAMGNLIDVWKKYRDSASGIPSYEELNGISSISESDIILNDGNIIKLSDVKLDLGCIAKGYVTQLAGELLESNGFDKYIISAGGNIKVGKKYSSNPYKIGIQDPVDKNNIYKIVNVSNRSVVTSGGYERFYTWEGVDYSHIIDPDTLYPSNYMKSVTVIMEDSAYADFFSTYLFMIPISDGINFVNSNSNIEAIWYGLDGKIYTSSGFSNYE